jgi:sterol desaturase/sphingolipid hydroxylase (fatty acid hydroxylase superfamily)
MNNDALPAASHSQILINETILLIAMVGFVILLFLEARKPYQRIDRQTQKASRFTNSTAFIFNNIVLTILKASSLFYIAQQFSHLGLLGSMDNGPLKWVISFLLFDLGMYAWHWSSHKYEFLWRFHKIHHSDKTVNVTTGFRFHIFDLFLEIIAKCLFVIIVGVEAYLVLGIELVEMIFIFFHHSNVMIKNEQQLSRYIITPFLHRTHHSAKRSEHDSNYGIVLSIWDQLFKTRKETEPQKIGLDLIEADNFVQLFFLAFITEEQLKKILRIIPRGSK